MDILIKLLDIKRNRIVIKQQAQSITNKCKYYLIFRVPIYQKDFNQSILVII